jgi:hypothetical protein
MENLNFKLSKQGYILNSRDNIEKISYQDYLRDFGADETTTPRGVAPRLFLDGKTLCTWGLRGNNRKELETYKTKKEAKNILFLKWENNLSEACEFTFFASSKKELFEYLAERFDKNQKVIKRYFRTEESKSEKLRLSKIKNDNRESFTVDMMIDFIKDNEIYIKEVLIELKALKDAENKELWQIKANSLVQRVSNNDFRVLKWKEIYNLIREKVK